jgi:hypothetical protein
MNLLAARAAAQKLAGRFLDEPKLPCASPEAGLLVLVYRQDDQEVISSVQVTISGKAVKFLPPKDKRHKGTVIRSTVRGKDSTTDVQGVARYLPLDPGKYTVAVTDLPDPDEVFEWPDPAEQAVTVNSCPICPISVTVKARPELRIVWTHDGKGMDGVGVKLGDDLVFEAATDDSGVTKWTQEAIAAGPYPVTLKFKDDARYELFDEGDQRVNAPAINLPTGRHRFTFKARRLAPLKLQVLEAKPDGKSAQLVKPKLTLKWPEDASQKLLELVDGVLEDIPQVNGPQAGIELEAVELPDDGTPEVFEFIELT